MAFDPIQEDCLRLILESMRRDRIYPLENALYIESCMASFNEDPAKLINNDRDRSFHLVAKATQTIDYRFPFITDDSAAEKEAAQAEAQLREACELDPRNWDARRMLAALQSESNDTYVSYLIDHRDEVERDLERINSEATDPYSREFARDLGRRPLIRWLAALSSRALISGRYRLALSAAEECLEFAADDPADVRHTALLALAKLECSAEDLERFQRKHAAALRPMVARARRHHLAEKAPDAWALLAELSVRYRSFDFAGATRALQALLQGYPNAAQPLYYQAEFPDGLFSRVNVIPGSEDELILAISEATPLLQEGFGAPENAGLSVWIANHEAVRAALENEDGRRRVAGRRSSGGDN